ncbi:unnamed protein product [Paramecium octaurelia]|uniref:USP domain-containing protein n=1 Tax=Paramecium octaurelia TaxID=43137 RepID=A0A8S1WU01_PAROT|nr:unnamed protein product [Paramecium octaurelia]
MHFRGLENLGNTCYMNSFIQALHLCSDFRQQVLDFEINRIVVQLKDYTQTKQVGNKPNIGLLLSLQKLFALLSFSSRDSINPIQFRMTLPDQFKNNYNQHDANEFGKILLDEIETSLKKLKIYENLIKDSFQGQIEWTIECLNCNQIVKTQEDILDLSLSIPNANSIRLEELVEQNCKPEIMDGDNQYQCDNCKAKTNAKRHFTIKKTAKNFIITLNRFDFKHSGNAKILTKVDIPNRIQINQQNLYLQAVIVHSGAQINYGHYFTLSRYTLLNDEQICRYPSIQTALQNLYVQQTPYILFYKTDYPYQVAKMKTTFLKNVIDQDNQNFLILKQQKQQQQQQMFQNQQNFNQRNEDDEDDNGQQGSQGVQNRIIF